ASLPYADGALGRWRTRGNSGARRFQPAAARQNKPQSSNGSAGTQQRRPAKITAAVTETPVLIDCLQLGATVGGSDVVINLEGCPMSASAVSFPVNTPNVQSSAVAASNQRTADGD